MTKPKGGRGNVAPYQTTHVRIPVPLKEQVDKLVEEYRDGHSKENSGLGINSSESKRLDNLSLAQAIEISKSLVKQRKSAKISLAKLLTSLYKEEVKPKDLS